MREYEIELEMFDGSQESIVSVREVLRIGAVEDVEVVDVDDGRPAG